MTTHLNSTQHKCHSFSTLVFDIIFKSFWVPKCMHLPRKSHTSALYVMQSIINHSTGILKARKPLDSINLKEILEAGYLIFGKKSPNSFGKYA